MESDDLRLDGNAAAGLLAEIFAVDVTTALATCAGCGATGPGGALLVYAHGMGTILRCPGCGSALIRVARGRRGYVLDLRGMRVLRVEPEA
ncbi:MAG TPA: DUF6510 family protein [Thermomicrobiales bacterium]|nr:DUF6510 family protein [Thermomicrobiales bacterium]